MCATPRWGEIGASETEAGEGCKKEQNLAIDTAGRLQPLVGTVNSPHRARIQCLLIQFPQLLLLLLIVASSVGIRHYVLITVCSEVIWFGISHTGDYLTEIVVVLLSCVARPPMIHVRYGVMVMIPAMCLFGWRRCISVWSSNPKYYLAGDIHFNF